MESNKQINTYEIVDFPDKMKENYVGITLQDDGGRERVRVICPDRRSITHIAVKKDDIGGQKYLFKKIELTEHDLNYTPIDHLRERIRGDVNGFANEIRILNNIYSKKNKITENIVKIIDQKITRKEVYYVATHYEHTLADKLKDEHKRRGTSQQHIEPDFNGKILEETFLPLDTVMYSIRTILETLDFLHNYQRFSFVNIWPSRRRILHRDISPKNIYIDNKGGEEKYILANFGCCSYFESIEPWNILTISSYRHPEAETEHFKNTLEPRMDIYSVGVTMYEMLTGNLPYSKKTLTQSRQRTCQENFKDIIPDSVGMLTKMVCYRALEYEKYTENPYTSVSDMLNDFNIAVKREFKQSS